MIIADRDLPELDVLLLIVLVVVAVLVLATSAGDRGDSPSPPAEGSLPRGRILSDSGPRGDPWGVVTLLSISSMAAGVLLALYVWLTSRGYIQ